MVMIMMRVITMMMIMRIAIVTNNCVEEKEHGIK